jgi:hypothetical protein
MACCSDPQIVHVLSQSDPRGWSRLSLRCADECESGEFGAVPHGVGSETSQRDHSGSHSKVRKETTG